MKKILTIIILTLSINCFSQTQSELNQQSYNEFNESDKKLNEIYQTILEEYQNYSVFIKNLKTSQRIWIQFRDAEMEMKYPKHPDNIHGSTHPTCSALYLKELTDKRIETLKDWLIGAEEGDACNGSVRIIGKIDSVYMQKAYIVEDSTILMYANMRKDHRIFGYKEKSTISTKMIVLSIFTDEVENNPFNCKYGAYYDTNGMTELKLKYISTEDDFLKMVIIKEGQVIDEVYMLKKWFEFEK